jgi:cytochrome b subunit of formate dehydrogenase
MSRQSLFAVNATIAFLLALQGITGIRLWFVDLIGWKDSETWMNVHLITGFGLLVLIAIHLYMNREWIKAQFSNPIR